MLGFKRSLLLFKVCTFLGHIFGQVLNNLRESQFELFLKVNAKILYKILIFLRDNSLFLFKILVDIIAYDLISKTFKTILIVKTTLKWFIKIKNILF